METIHNKHQSVDSQSDSFHEFETYDARICIMTKILSLMSGRWKPIILHLVKHDINRFGLLQKSMPSISKKVLTNQLRELEADELITRNVIEPNHPQVVVYNLTVKGSSLRQLIDGMVNWGFLNLSQGQPPVDRH